MNESRIEYMDILPHEIRALRDRSSWLAAFAANSSPGDR